MTCPHCGYLLQPLDIDCVCCRQRGYAPSYSAPAAPVLPFAVSDASTAQSSSAVTGRPYTPLVLPAVPRSRAPIGNVIVTLTGVSLLLGTMTLNVLVHEQRYARQEAEIAVLQEEIRLMQPAGSHPLSVSRSLLDNPLNLQSVPDIPFESRMEAPAIREKVVHRYGWDPFRTIFRIVLPAHNGQRQQSLHRQGAYTKDSQQAHMSLAYKGGSAPRVRNMRDPFNAFKRF